MLKICSGEGIADDCFNRELVRAAEWLWQRSVQILSLVDIVSPWLVSRFRLLGMICSVCS